MKQQMYLVAAALALTTSPALSRPPQDHLGYVSKYASYYHIDRKEALRRMAETDKAIEVQTKLRVMAPHSFAGMHIEHKPKFRVVTKFTQMPSKPIRQIVAGEFFRIETAPYSEKELRSALDAVSKDLSSRNLRYMAGIDVRKSKILVEVAPEDVPKIGTSYAKDAGAIYEWRTTQGFVTPTFAPYAAYRGGDRLWSASGMFCTSGFHAKLADGTPVITTAGHCDNEMRIWNSTGRVISWINEKDKGSFDIQWHRHTSSVYYLHPSIEAGSATYDIRAVRPSSQMGVGQLVCKYGQKTYLTCGEIIRLDFTRDYKGAPGTYIQVRNEAGNMMNDHGDSGGPVYAWHEGVGYTAYGMVHGRGDDGTSIVKDLFFMPSEKFAEAGLSIMLRTN